MEMVYSNDTIVTEKGRTFSLIYKGSKASTSKSRLKYGLSELDIGKRAMLSFKNKTYEERERVDKVFLRKEEEVGILSGFKKSYSTEEGHIFHGKISYISGSTTSVQFRSEHIKFC